MKNNIYSHYSFLILYLSSALCLTTTLVGSATPITLEHTTQQALKNHAATKAADAHVQAAQAHELVAKSGYNPRLALSYNSTFTRSNSTTALKEHFITLTASQLIISGNNPLQKRAIAHQATQERRWQYTQQNHTTRHEIVQAFIQAWLIQEKERYRQSHYTADCTAFSEQRALVTHGKELVDTAFSALSERLGSEIPLTVYPEEKQAAYSKICRLIGIQYLAEQPPTLSYTPPQFAPTDALKPLATYIEQALKSHPIIHAARARKNKLSAEKVSIYQQYLPTVHLTGALQSRLVDDTTTFSTDGFAGVRVNWQVFDGFTTQYQSQEKESLGIRADYLYKEARAQVQEQVTQAYYTVKRHLLSREQLVVRHDAACYEHKKVQREHRLGSTTYAATARAQAACEKTSFALLEHDATAALHHDTLLYLCGYPETLT